jgi:membrane glycosyltransferase
MAYRRFYPPLHSPAADLAQTVVATWYMKTILPYQGWALINPADMVGQNLWISFMQLLPYVLQSGILILFAVLFAGCQRDSGLRLWASSSC